MSSNGDMPAMAHTHSMKKTHPVPHEEVHYFPGLTKREVFAALAMQGLMANGVGRQTHLEKITELSVNVADALLAELAKKAGE